MPIATGTALALGSTALSAGTGLLGSRAQAKGAKAAAAIQQQQYEQTREDFAPYREAGARGLEGWEAALGSDQIPLGLAQYAQGFQASPGYQYQLREGQSAIQNSAAASGMLQSGRTLRGLQEHAQGLANQDYWNYVGQNRAGTLDRYNQRQDGINNYRGLASAGQNAVAQTGTAGQNAASGIANAYQAAGNARASGYQGLGSAINSGLGNAAGFSGFNQGLQGF